MQRLLPYPRTLIPQPATLKLPESGLLLLDLPRATEALFIAQQAQAVFASYAALPLELSASPHVPALLRLSLNPALPHPQGYRLRIEASAISVTARELAGLFYGVGTLRQLMQVHGRELPCLLIDDAPDFPVRGVMLDISRDKVLSLETLYQLVDLLAGWKINQLQLYMEHSFAYHGHAAVWQDASPLTAGDILALDAYCRQRFVELVPNQNSFGHMHRWLQHPAYRHLGETEQGIEMPWGEVFPHPFSFSPAVPETLTFLESLYDELLPNFSSRLFNVGADETFDLGAGRSAAMVAARGKGRVYLDYLLEIYRRVKARGYTMQFWGDIINQYPDLVPLLPRDAIALEWGYEADHDFAGKTALFAASGIPYYVCPGTSSWNSIAGRTDNAIANIRSAVAQGLQHGAVGVLNTDWGDNGHWQPLPVSYLGFAYGAALSWCYQQNEALDLPAALDAFAFEDSAGVMGRLAYDLGNLYQQPGVLLHNSSLLFWLYLHPLEKLSAAKREALGQGEGLRRSITAAEGIIAHLDSAAMQRPDAALIQQEYRYAAAMLMHGARRGLFMLGAGDFSAADLRQEAEGLQQMHREVWLGRNRPGGWGDSVARLRVAP